MNRIVNIILLIILIVGLVVREVLGLLFVFSAFGWLVAALIFADALLNGRCYRKNSADFILKSIYVLLCFFILNIEPKILLSYICVAVYVVLLVVDILFVKIKYNLSQLDMSIVNKNIKNTEKTIALEHSSFIFGKKNVLTNNKDYGLYIRALSYITYSFIWIIVATASSVFLGEVIQDYFTAGLTIIVFAAISNILLHKIWSASSFSKKVWRLISFLAPLKIVLLYLASYLKTHSEIAQLTGLYLYLYLCGVGIAVVLLFFNINISRACSKKIAELREM